ncbi:hypothetical protein IWW38_002035 [Coemansia aciculifera]|uniref:Uncharacterized protein n=1 Tax=Coemansia aciculifera TaxID=417176 RepID=A0ACC1M5J0_9FUNG|nr:hypothetical protein IWW38_002035 [Coemansia aciculifera]
MFSAIAAVSPVANRASLVNSWLAKIGRSDQAPCHAQPSMANNSSDSDNDECERSLADDTTLCTPPELPQRSRAASSASEEGSSSSAAASGYSTNVFASTEVLLRRNRGVSESSQLLPALNHARIDTAIALAIRARQEDEQGRHEVAARLLVAAMDRLSASLHETEGIRDPLLRERLQMHRLLLESGDNATVGLDSYRAPALQPSAQTPNDAYNANEDIVQVAQCGLFDKALCRVRATATLAADRGLSLANQAIIMWLVFLGNVCVWAATQFRNSQLPELIVQGLTMAGAWAYEACRVRQVPQHALRIGQSIMAWLIAMDRETCFTQRVLCSAAAILGAIARVAEQSSTRPTGSTT